MSEREGRRVLVIYDDDLSREVLGLLLGDAGYEVSSASSGEEALAALQADEARPDVVLMDWQMPGVSGNELAQGLREMCGQSTLLLAMSGSKVLEGIATDGFLLKPFSMEEFESFQATEPMSQKRDMGHPALNEEALQSGAPGIVGESMSQERDPSTGSGQAMAHPDGAGSIGERGADEVLDPQVFGGFEAMMGTEPLRELYRHCLIDADKHVALMERALAASDDAGLRKNAHAIKGSLGMVGARELQGLCSVLEESGIADDHAATLAELPDALLRLRRMLIARGVEI